MAIVNCCQFEPIFVFIPAYQILLLPLLRFMFSYGIILMLIGDKFFKKEATTKVCSITVQNCSYLSISHTFKNKCIIEIEHFRTKGEKDDNL